MRSAAIRWMTLLLLIIMSGISLVGVAAADSFQNAAAQTLSVLISGFKFQRDTLTVNAGDTIEWKNSDIVPHTVTAVDGRFHSGKIALGATWKFVAEKNGDVRLHLHASPKHAREADRAIGILPMPTFPLPQFSPDHIHPILVNFTAALVPASVGSDVAGRVLRKSSLHSAAWWMLVYATAITPFTALAGLWWKRRVGDMLPPELVVRHQWLGIGLAISFTALLLWRSAYRKGEAPSLPYFAFSAVLVGGLVIQGTLGGAMLLGH